MDSLCSVSAEEVGAARGTEAAGQGAWEMSQEEDLPLLLRS